MLHKAKNGFCGIVEGRSWGGSTARHFRIGVQLATSKSNLRQEDCLKGALFIDPTEVAYKQCVYPECQRTMNYFLQLYYDAF